MNIVSSQFLGNAGSNGGAVGLLQSNGHIADSSFESNAATGRGRNDALPDAAGCPGVRHAGQGGSGGNGGNGGALIVDGTDDAALVICDSTFITNRANELAGAVFRTANAAPRRFAITNCAFIANQAAQGGALFLMNVSALEITASRFIGNVATIAGAAHMVQTKLLLNDTEFSINRATEGVGGALLLTGAAPASRFREVSFTANESAIGGGLFACAVFGADALEIENAVRSDMPATVSGSLPVTQEHSGDWPANPIQKSKGKR